MVASPALPKRYSVDDLAQFPDDGKLRELVDGQLVEWDMPNVEHGSFVAALLFEIMRFVREHRLGRVVTNDAMVRILGSAFDARGADIAFYQRGRVPQDVRAAATETVPDFVIEVLSPSDRAGLVLEKVKDWLNAGVRLLWYIDPETGSTTVYHGDHVIHVPASGMLDGADVLPGLQLRLQDILDELADTAE
jgi:Uma2 family endonuclease